MEQKFVMDIPDEKYCEFLAGRIDISNAVARLTDSGRIDSYIPLNPCYEDSQSHSISYGAAAGIAAGAVAITLVVGGLITYVIKKNKKKTMPTEIPEEIQKFQQMLRIYLSEAKSGNLDVATVCEMIDVLNELESKHNESFQIDFSSSEILELLQIILEYSNKLNEECKAVHITHTVSNNSHSNFMLLKECLIQQKHYFEQVA